MGWGLVKNKRSKGMKNLMKRMRDLNGAKVEIGYFPENGIHPSGLSYVSLFTIHSLGANSVGIPPRPILDLTTSLYDPIKGSKRIDKWLTKYLSKIDQKTPPISMSRILDKIGSHWVHSTRKGFGDTSKLESNTDFTIMLKPEIGNKPLIHGSYLKENLSYVNSFNGNVVIP